MNKITVWSALAAVHIAEHGTVKYDSAEWSGNVNVRMPDDAWRFFNRIDKADNQRLTELGYRLPSMSIGDLLTLDGTTHLCLPLGFCEAGVELVRRLKSDPRQAWLIALER